VSARVLVVGSGGREHALAWALRRAPTVAEVVVAPGNAGIASVARCVPLPAHVDEVAAMAVAEGVDLVVVGPEAPLAAGLADACVRRGVLVYGPSAAATRLESSKSFAKDFMVRHHIPTATYRTFTDAGEAHAHVRSNGAPIVVKVAGLAGGKGVTVAHTVDAASAAIDAAFAEGPGEIVVEEYLEGQEVSLLAVCDGRTALPLPLAQDHKYAFDGDRGPMTGGMGAVAPVGWLAGRALDEVVGRIVQATVDGMRREGNPFVGTLFVGLMLTRDGPRVLEYNVRFGDPEAQAVLPLLETDLFALLRAAAEGNLPRSPLPCRAGAAACVVMAAPGYPGAYATGLPIDVPDDLGDDVMVFHAGTARSEGRLVSAGGRVLAVTAVAATHVDAVRRAYAAVDRVGFAGAHVRRDIGARVIGAA
jgi:phosphoribosylamine---glycine ligase